MITLPYDAGKQGNGAYSPLVVLDGVDSEVISGEIKTAGLRRISIQLSGIITGEVNLEVCNGKDTMGADVWFAVAVINLADMTEAIAMDEDSIYEFNGHADKCRLNVVDATDIDLAGYVSGKGY